MFSSLYNHSFLFITCTIILLLSLSFFKHLRSHSNSFQSEQISLIYDSHQTQISFIPLENITKFFSKSDDEKTNEISLRQKLLNTNAKSHSIFDRFVFINPPKSVCSNLKDPNNSMIIVILSQALNFDYRQAIRATWGRSETYNSINISVCTVFFVAVDDTIQKAVRNEQTIFNDVVEIGIPENQAFVVYKELAALFWLRLYCPLVRILFRMDEDVLLDIFLLLKHIKHEINLEENDGLYGWFRFNRSVLRLGIWAVTRHEYKPNIYPPYTLNIGYVFSNYSCKRLVETANHSNQQIIRINDAYITGILRDLAQIPFYTYSNINYTLAYGNHMTCIDLFQLRLDLVSCTSKLFIGIRGDLDEYYDTWDILLNKHNKSLNNFSS